MNTNSPGSVTPASSSLHVGSFDHAAHANPPQVLGDEFVRQASLGKPPAPSGVSKPVTDDGTPQASVATLTAATPQQITELTREVAQLGGIPAELSDPEAAVYRTLINVVAERHKTGQGALPLVVITDLAKDYDDLAALTVLKELHRLGLVQLRGVVANLMPAQKRAAFARGALDSLGLPDVPAAVGSRGSPQEHEELAHEFSCELMANDEAQYDDGQALLVSLYEQAAARGEKMTLLCLSSLQDADALASAHPDLVAGNTLTVHMQGGNDFSSAGELQPDDQAQNNFFNRDAAVAWHHFVQSRAIPTHTYTKQAAFATPLTSELFIALEQTGHPIGKHLRKVQVAQDLAFYERACKPNPADRFRPFMDQAWYLKNKTNWFARQHPEGTPLPLGEAVIPYLTKVVVYDALAALGAAGEDAVEALGVYHENKRIQFDRRAAHALIGDTTDSGVDSDKIATALTALMKGSLLAVQQGLPASK